jgi:IPT/TIG domain
VVGRLLRNGRRDLVVCGSALLAALLGWAPPAAAQARDTGGTRLTLDFVPPPAVLEASPLTGLVAGGTVVTVSGTDFQPGATLSFGGTPATGVTFVSTNTLNALTPVHAAGAVTVTVTNPDNQSGGLAAAFTYLPGPAPSVSGIAPNHGATLGGTAVTITGTNFVNGATVAIGGVPATGVSFVDATTLTATAGARAKGIVDVVVTNPDPQSATLVGGYAYTAPPVPADLFTLAPCRVVDTRSLSTGGPALAAFSTRTFALAGSCGVPATAVAVAANLTVVSGGAGYFAAFPADVVNPGNRNVSFGAGQTRAANAILAVASDGTASVSVANVSAGANEFILDVSGWFE